MQNELYDILYKVNITEEANEIKVNITETEEAKERTLNITENQYINDKDFMSKYWEIFNMRKLEERNRRKTEVIYNKPCVIFKRDKDINEKEVNPKHIDNSYLYNFVKKYLSLKKVKKFSKLICLINNFKSANDNKITLMEYNNNTFEVDELHKLVATEKIKIKHIIKVYNSINKQTTGIRDFLKKN